MNESAVQGPELVHYLPIATTLVSAAFFVVLIRRYLIRRTGTHLLWWATGVFFYGVGTAIESYVTLAGNSPVVNKAWYVAGALLGGYPLAQGTVYLLFPRRTAHWLTGFSLPLVIGLSALVILSPTRMEALEPFRPSGAAIGWQWIRPLTPLVNLYAAFFLIGGAVLSALRYAQDPSTRHRAIGNALIAVGAILPGIGGGMAKAGFVEVLYVGEFVGILLIWAGYASCVGRPAVSALPAATGNSV